MYRTAPPKSKEGLSTIMQLYPLGPWDHVNAFRTGNLFVGDRLLGISTGRGPGARKGLSSGDFVGIIYRPLELRVYTPYGVLQRVCFVQYHC